VVSEMLANGGKVVLDLSGVTSIDSAGIGELAFLHTWARAQNADLKFASPTPFVRDLLGLTNLDSVLEIHPSLCEALAAFQSAEAWPTADSPLNQTAASPEPKARSCS
jgi:anti-anti-sigma regulatory factor